MQEKALTNKSIKESVWDYPRPPKLEKGNWHIQVVFNEVIIADTRNAYRVLETSHPPTYYLPREDIRDEVLRKTTKTSLCEFKGQAAYFTVAVNGKEALNAAWHYPNPTPNFHEIKEHVAFYAQWMDACYVDGELVRPQPGLFYGGWITENLIGPFKGGPEPKSW